MADSSFKNAVVQVKLAYDLVDYISRSGVQLKQQGSKWKGLCPFHNEKTPSFVVDSHFQNYRCWGCGANGDLIAYVEKTEALEFFDALKKLAEDKNIELNISDSREAGVDYKSLREVLKETANFFYQEYKKLPSDHVAKVEVTKRKLKENSYLFGYAPEGRQTLYKHLKAMGFTDEVMLQAGVCFKFENQTQPGLFDFWNGRLMFFFTDVTGKPVGFSGRKLHESDKRGKYVNSPDGPLFDKSSVLFNIAKAKKAASDAKKIYVNEGQFDVVSLVVAGAQNAVASSGTAFTEKQGLILRRLVTEEGKIVFCFDGDTAGIKAAEKVFTNIPSIHAQTYVVSLPEGEDPDTYRQQHGNEALVEYLESHEVPIVEFVLNVAAKNFDLTNVVESSKFVETAARILRTVSSNVLRDTYIKKVALDSFTSIEVVRAAVKDAKPLTTEGPAPQGDEEAGEQAASRYGEAEAPEDEEKSLDELRDLMEQDELYDVTARLLALALQEQTLVSKLEEAQELIPEPFATLAAELAKLEEGQPVLPEVFSRTELAEYLIVTNFFPFGHLFDEERRASQFAYLRDRLLTVSSSRKEQSVRAKVAQVLMKSPTASAEFLEKALEAEERGLTTLGVTH